jgi:hypothetical protein
MAVEKIDSLAVRELDASAIVEANGTETVTISNVAPAGVGTATISKWLKVVDQGTVYYIPMWS